MTEPDAAAIAPVRKSVVVRRTPEEAFAIFTERFGAWWPYTRFSIGQARVTRCELEPRLGGAIFEETSDGGRAPWGSISEWDPPRRLVLSWHPDTPAAVATRVEVRFTPVAGGTRVDLEHSGWERLGAKGAAARNNYDGGWVVVFEQRFLEACA